MLVSDRFLRFAAECEVMAQRCPDPENRVVWRGLAARWVRCAELTEQRDAARTAHAGQPAKQRGLAVNVVH